RDFHVTGVQTCALPISAHGPPRLRPDQQVRRRNRAADGADVRGSRARVRRPAPRRSRQLPAGPTRRGAQLRGERGQRDAPGHGALRWRVHLHHEPVRPHRRGRLAALRLQAAFPAARFGPARAHVHRRGARWRCRGARTRYGDSPGSTGTAHAGGFRGGHAAVHGSRRTGGAARVPRAARARTCDQAGPALRPPGWFPALMRRLAGRIESVMGEFDDARDTWDRRFASAEGLLFGEEPNPWLAAHYRLLPAGGKVLCVADGESRNGVFLAEAGFDVTAFDISPVAVEKARALAARRGVKLELLVADAARWSFE